MSEETEMKWGGTADPTKTDAEKLADNTGGNEAGTVGVQNSQLDQSGLDRSQEEKDAAAKAGAEAARLPEADKDVSTADEASLGKEWSEKQKAANRAAGDTKSDSDTVNMRQIYAGPTAGNVNGDPVDMNVHIAAMKARTFDKRKPTDETVERNRANVAATAAQTQAVTQPATPSANAHNPTADDDGSNKIVPGSGNSVADAWSAGH